MNSTQLTRIIGSHLRSWQRIRNYTEIDMGHLLSIPPKTYQNIIIGTVSPTLELICRIGQVMGIQPHVLLIPINSDGDVVDSQFSHRMLLEKLMECHNIAAELAPKRRSK